MSWVTLVGAMAAACSTTAYLPQTIRAWRTRSTGDISALMFAMMVAGTSLWLVYGIALASWPIIAANGTTLLMSAMILFLKLRHG